jgi:hypothetical protein
LHPFFSSSVFSLTLCFSSSSPDFFLKVESNAPQQKAPEQKQDQATTQQQATKTVGFPLCHPVIPSFLF